MTKEVRYTREEFINSFAKNAQAIATRYCDENPKDTYGHEDHRAMYYLMPDIVANGGPVGHGLWDETQTSMDRIITTFEKNEWGE